MLEIIKSDTHFKFSNKFKFTALISGILVLSSIFLVFGKGLNYGVDFRGGAEIQVTFTQTVELGEIRTALERDGFKSVTVQTIGEEGQNSFLIKVLASEENLNQVTEDVSKALRNDFKDRPLDEDKFKTDIVGPKAGAELRKAGFQAMLWALLAIMVYISLRFEFKYSPGAIAALAHDVLIILGIFVLMNKEFTLQIVAALLAVIGYSVNDTVVVYDRVREHEEKFAGRNLTDHIDNAVNETLSRTVLTSGTTLFISFAMQVMGGGSIHDFFVAISLGVVVGTYSSIFVAAPVTLFFDKMKSKKEVSA